MCVKTSGVGAESGRRESKERDRWGRFTSCWRQSKEVGLLFSSPKTERTFEWNWMDFSLKTWYRTKMPKDKRDTFTETLISSLCCYSLSRVTQSDLSIDMETEEDWDALSFDPNQPLITRKVNHHICSPFQYHVWKHFTVIIRFSLWLPFQVKGGVATCRRWLRGRSLYFSRLLTSRARSRHIFLAYLLTLHVLVLMCLTGAL